MKLIYMNHRELKKYIDSPFFLPVGTIEAHGGGPLGTDVIIPQYISEKVAEIFNGVELPPVYYGITNSLFGYPGTIDVGDILEEYVYRIGSSLSKYGVKYLFIMNGHGGQIDEMKRVCSRLWKEKGIFTALINWWIACGELCKETFGALTGHSGADEFSAVAAILSLDFKEWREEKKFNVIPGINTYPSPAPILNYSTGEGKEPDMETGNRFLEQVIECLKEKISEILQNWRSFP